MLIDVDIETETYYVREPDGGEWDCGESAIRLLGVTAREYSGQYVDAYTHLPVDYGDTVYVLIEHYSDGSTFGSSEYMEIKGVFMTAPQAWETSEHLNKDHGYFGSHIDFIVEPAIVGKARP